VSGAACGGDGECFLVAVLSREANDDLDGGRIYGGFYMVVGG
jgi:hypothetical protein